MNHSEFWDNEEFDFFKTLSDSDKLLYIYDLFLGDFDTEYKMDGRLEYGDGDFDFDRPPSRQRSESLFRRQQELFNAMNMDFNGNGNVAGGNKQHNK